MKLMILGHDKKPEDLLVYYQPTSVLLTASEFCRFLGDKAMNIGPKYR